MFEKIGDFVLGNGTKLWLAAYLVGFAMCVFILVLRANDQEYFGFSGAIYNAFSAIGFFFLALCSAFQEDDDVRYNWIVTYSFSKGVGRANLKVLAKHRKLTLKMVQDFEKFIVKEWHKEEPEVCLTNARRLDRI